jgi:hypothetical protein
MKELIRVSLMERCGLLEPAAWLAPWQAEPASPSAASYAGRLGLEPPQDQRSAMNKHFV